MPKLPFESRKTACGQPELIGIHVSLLTLSWLVDHTRHDRWAAVGFWRRQATFGFLPIQIPTHGPHGHITALRLFYTQRAPMLSLPAEGQRLREEQCRSVDTSSGVQRTIPLPCPQFTVSRGTVSSAAQRSRKFVGRGEWRWHESLRHPASRALYGSGWHGDGAWEENLYLLQAHRGLKSYHRCIRK